MLFKPHFDFAADAGAGSGGGSEGNDGKQEEGKQEAAPKFEEWVKGQPENVRTMLDEHTRGLKSALDSERESRKNLEKQVRELAKNSEAGSQAQKDLEKLANDLSAADQRADFYEKAHAAGISNLKLAYLLATTEDYIDKRGNVNFESMKQGYPELFGQTKQQQKPPVTNAGTQSNQQLQTQTMNNFIRAAAGRPIS